LEVFDCHMHIGTLVDILPDAQAAGGQAILPAEQRDAERQVRLQVMAANGIERGLLLAALAYPQPDGIADTRRVNDGLAAYRDADPAHFPVALGVVEPLHGERGLEELDRLHFELGMRGVMWHHRLQGTYLDHRMMRPILRKLREYKMVPFIHTNAQSKLESPWRLAMLAEEFPDLPFVALDPFSSFEQAEECLYLARHAPNLHFDTALLAGGPGLVKRFLAQFGSERLLYGSNLYSPPQNYQKAPFLDDLRTLDIPDADKANILGGNVRRLFGLTETLFDQ
jgi:predicted TIM-barrel fold metal-dependent hydrolase